MTFDSRLFRDVMGSFATGVTVVTSTSQKGEPLGITVNSFSSVSLEPPLVLFCLGYDGNHCREFQESESYAIHILADDQGDICGRFASPMDNRFNGIDHTKAGEESAPVIPGCAAVIECQQHQLIEAGDHLIFLCAVTNLQVDMEKKPLLYYRGGFPLLA